MEATSSTSPPPKFSRYRTVRERAATLQTLSSQSDNEHLSIPPLPKAATFESEGAVKRAPSRYRRRQGPTTASPTTSPPLPAGPLPDIVGAHATGKKDAVGGKSGLVPERYHRVKEEHGLGVRDAPDMAEGHNGRPVLAGKQRDTRGQVKHSASIPQQQAVLAGDRYDRAREEARLILEGEYDRLQKMKKQSEKQKQLPNGQGAPDMRRRRRSSPHSSGKQGKSGAVANGQIPTDSIRRPEAEAQVHASTKRETKHSQRPQTPPKVTSAAAIPSDITPHSPPRPHHSPSRPQHTTNFDAPISAVNAPGDRRVTLHYQHSRITLPVTPTTTAKDLLNSASIVLSNPPDPRTAILLESFSSAHLALERPLRRYERIRDVLNSWDSDASNHLIIDSGEGDSERKPIAGLDLPSVPANVDKDVTVQMYHATHPGRWNKRWVRLRTDGQVTVSKNESGMESSNVCHLSDFDLYGVTKSLLKKLRAPKRTVWAVKSQQKSSLFLESGATMVHFFASGNKEVADQWYSAVHGWRSWYLVNVLGEGRVANVMDSMMVEEVQRPGTAGSAGTVPYQLGSFKPLLDLGGFEEVGADGGRGVDTRRSVDGGMIRRAGTLKANHLRLGSVDSHRPAPVQPFTGKGLLAHATVPVSLQPHGYEAHNSPTAEVVVIEDTNAGFTGRGLLARSGTQRSQGGRGTGRGVSGVKGRALVDLTPESEFADGSLLRKLEAWKMRDGESAH